ASPKTSFRPTRARALAVAALLATTAIAALAPTTAAASAPPLKTVLLFQDFVTTDGILSVQLPLVGTENEFTQYGTISVGVNASDTTQWRTVEVVVKTLSWHLYCYARFNGNVATGAGSITPNALVGAVALTPAGTPCTVSNVYQAGTDFPGAFDIVLSSP